MSYGASPPPAVPVLLRVAREVANDAERPFVVRHRVGRAQPLPRVGIRATNGRSASTGRHLPRAQAHLAADRPVTPRRLHIEPEGTFPPGPGPLAQWVEHRTFNPPVVGSSPTGPTTRLRRTEGVFISCTAFTFAADAIRPHCSSSGTLPGRSWSSAVAIARATDKTVDVLILGDTQVATPTGTLRDDRIAAIATEPRTAYRVTLAAGLGYEDTHRDLLSGLEAEQIRDRNKPGGCWIAEAVPEAPTQSKTARRQDDCDRHLRAP